MSKRLVIILWAVALVLGGLVYYVKSGQGAPPKIQTQRVAGQTLFDKFPAADVAAVTVSAADGTVHLAKKDGKWTVTDRDGYPANTSMVNELIRTMAEVKIAGAVEGGAQALPRFGIDEGATKADDRGVAVTFANAAGGELAKVSLGKNVGADGSDPMTRMSGGSTGRFILNHADTTAIYKTSEMFASLSSDPKTWLAEGFIDIEKPKSIAVTVPGKSDIAWKLSRETEEANFALEGATEADKFDPSTTLPLKSLFASARFDDVVPAADIEKRANNDQKRVATFETIEGFTYTLTLTPAKSITPTPAPEPGEPPAGDNLFVTVDVKATLPTERKKEADEKPEDAKAKDEAFQSRLKTLQEKLVKEQALKGRTFEFRAYALDALTKGREGFKKQDAPPAGAQGNPMQGMPPGMMMPPGMRSPGGAPRPPVEAVTPPIAVPEENK